MRLGKILVAASAVGSAMGAGLCSKYTVALLKKDTPTNQLTLLTLLVKTAVLGPFTGKGTPNPTLPGNMYKFSGLLAPGSFMGTKVNLAGYFDGSMATTNMGGKPTKVNWLDGVTKALTTDPTSSGTKGSNTETLLTHLYSYFGLLLQCDVGMGGFPAYAGVSSQYSVHEYMKLSEAEFAYFVENVGWSALSFGAAMKDAVAVGTALNDTFGMRCSPPAAVDAGKELQAICIDKTCPLSKGAVCSQYAPAQKMSGGGGGGGAASTMSVSKSLTGIVGFLVAAFAWL